MGKEGRGKLVVFICVCRVVYIDVCIRASLLELNFLLLSCFALLCLGACCVMFECLSERVLDSCNAWRSFLFGQELTMNGIG